MNDAVIVLQCDSKYQIETTLRCLDMFGYVWGGSKHSLIDFTPFSLEKGTGKNTNIIIRPQEKDVRYNFSIYEGLADCDGVNYVIKVH